jgi:hypothetical protein
MTYWRWPGALLLLASEELPIDVVLLKQQCGESCMFSVCVSFISRMSKLCSRTFTLHCKDSVTGCSATWFSAQNFFTDETFFNKDGITNIRNPHIWSSQEKNPYTNTETHPDHFLGENLVRCYRKTTRRTFWTWRSLDRRAPPTLLAGSFHSCYTGRLWSSVGRCGCSKMEHPLVLVVLPFSIDSFQTVV